MIDRYAVIGNPISHSKSPIIHGSFAKATGQNIEYSAIESTPEGFTDAVRGFRDSGGLGMNVTAPFKLQAFELADQHSDRAQQAGASNTLGFKSGLVIAENFDGIGLVTDLQHNLGMPLATKRILLLGAGGSMRGALLPLLAEQPAKIVVANRTASKALLLATRFASHGEIRGISYAELGAEQFDLVINGTSASQRGELPPVPPTVFADGGMAYDLVYGKGLTPFLRVARNAGVKRLADGVGMLVEQAAEAFFWWRGVRPDTRPVIDKLKVPLQ